MSLSSATSRVSYTGNGATDTYSYTFRIFDQDDLLVTVRNTSDVETTLAITTDYTVTGVGDLNGGSIALVNSSQAWLDGDGDLKSNYVLTIRRVRSLVQETDIRNQGTFYPETHEDAFDHGVMISQQQQDEIDRSVKLPETITSSDFDPTLPADIAGVISSVPITNATGDGWGAGTAWVAADDISNAQTYANNASASATLASQWATLTSGQVATTDYSAKAWAIGGTGVTDTASRGAAKEWAIETASTVDGTDYSAKEWAKGTQVRGAASGGSAKDWATYTGGTADDTSHSAKAWAVGGTGVSATASAGASKEWATKTSAAVDTSEFSAKEYAQGTQAATGGSSKNWAQQTGADVAGAAANSRSAKSWAQEANTGATLGGSAKDWAQNTSVPVDGSTGYSAKEHAQGTQTRGAASGGSSKDWATYTAGSVDNADHSAKAWAVGGTGVTDTASKGAAKEWAIETASTVDGTDYSAKEWAKGTQTRGAASGGSAKDWATYTGGTVDNTEYSAKYYSQQTAAAVTSHETSHHKMTTAGDIEYYNGGIQRLGIGSSNQVLTVSGGIPAWGAAAAGGINYISANPSAEADVSGWTAYSDIQTATMTIASPAVVTITSTTGVVAGDAITFTTTGALPTGVTAGTTYYVSSIVSGTTFQFSATLGGSAVNTSGSQSGTHTFRPLKPIDGTGGSPTLTITRTTTTPLRGTGSLLITPSGTSTIGEGVYFTITPDLADFGNVVEYGHDFDFVTATGATGDYVVYVVGGTSGTVIQPAGYQITGATTGIYGKFKCTFQLNMTDTTYRICIHNVASTSALLEFDNIYCGPQLKSYGPFISDWVDAGACTIEGSSSNPTKGTIVSDTLKWRRVGDSMELTYNYRQSTGGSGGTGYYLFKLPTGYTIDSNKVTVATIAASGTRGNVGSASACGGGADPLKIGYVVAYDTTHLALVVGGDTFTTTAVQSGHSAALSAGGTEYSFHAMVPITGWSSGMLLSSDSGDSRVVAALYTGGGPTGTLTNSYNAVTFGTKVLDTHSGLSGSVYTIQVPGVYQISAGTAQSATYSVGKIAVLSIWVDGNQCETAIVSAGGAQSTLYPTVTSMARYYTAGQQITIKSYNDATTPTFGSSTTQNWFSINRSGGNQTLAASESVNARYYTANGDTINSAVFSTINFLTKDYDSHNAVTIGVGAWSAAAGGNATSNWKFTAPVSGKYRISGSVYTGNTTNTSIDCQFVVIKNGSYGPTTGGGINSPKSGTASTPIAFNGSFITNLIAGDTIALQAYQGSGGAVSLISNGTYNWISIDRVGN